VFSFIFQLARPRERIAVAMGCGASSDPHPASAASLARQRVAAAPLRDLEAALSLITAPAAAPPSAARGQQQRLCIGVFGLRGAGKSALLHSVRAQLASALGAPAVLPTTLVPLTAPTQRLELFSGPLPPLGLSSAAVAAAAASASDAAPSSAAAAAAAPSVDLVAIDTPGLPFGVAQRRLLRRLLPRLHRIVWVVDSPLCEADLRASAREMADLWSEVLLACSSLLASSSPAVAAVAAANVNQPIRVAAAPVAPSSAIPSLHLVCTKQSLPSAASIDALRAAHIISAAVKNAPPHATIVATHGYSCEWDGARKDTAIRALLVVPGPVGSAWTAESAATATAKKQARSPSQIHLASASAS